MLHDRSRKFYIIRETINPFLPTTVQLACYRCIPCRLCITHVSVDKFSAWGNWKDKTKWVVYLCQTSKNRSFCCVNMYLGVDKLQDIFCFVPRKTEYLAFICFRTKLLFSVNTIVRLYFSLIWLISSSLEFHLCRANFASSKI